jgi:undecaprenyl-diphosphatase
MSSLLQFDMAARSWVVLHRVDPLTGPLYVLTVAGRFGAIWIVCALALAAARRLTWRRAASVLLAIAIPLAVSDYVLKPIVARPRPFVAAPAPAAIGRLPHDASFPSGHATSSFAGATALTMVEPHLAVLWWVLAAAIAYSRIYLGVHYPLDVLAGGGIGALGAWLIMTRRFAHR